MAHDHVFLGDGHEQSERRTWNVVALCAVMMVLEIGGGVWFGSIALVADGMHMSTHAGALLLAAVAYRFARRHANDPRFSFGTGKLGDLAGFTSAVILLMISLLIGYEAVSRFLSPVPIHFAEAIPIACLGLVVNALSAWLLSGGAHGHSHGHGHGQAQGHGPAHDHNHGDDAKLIETASGSYRLEIFEDGVPPRFRLRGLSAPLPEVDIQVNAAWPDGRRQSFMLSRQAQEFLESEREIPEPHTFTATVVIAGTKHDVLFEEHAHGGDAASRDNNMRAAFVHILADAAVSVLVILGLILAKLFGWLWMDPLVGIIGALVIASWAYGLIRDTGAILLDMNPDRTMAESLKRTIEDGGDELADLHLWRVGPGHLGAIISLATRTPNGPDYYRAKLAHFKNLSHLTVEVQNI
jgi:cation diffusion facilitator family transporter